MSEEYSSSISSSSVDSVNTFLHDNTPILKKHSWTRRDYQLAALAALVKFGDGVEVYLPGVITQVVSCELGVSQFEEALLGTALFFAMTLAIFIATPITNRFGVRPVVLVSLYTSILFTVLCALVPNYYTLLLSRVLIGIGLGLNICPVIVFCNELASSYRVQKVVSFMGTLCFCVGGTWISLLGYLILDLVGWRVFVLLTSVPVFIPPLIMLHCTLRDSNACVEYKLQATTSQTPNFARKVANIGLLSMISNIQGVGSILLVPSVIRAFNIRDHEELVGTCNNAVQGIQFLILAAVCGGPNVMGRVVSISTHGKYSFKLGQISLSILLAINYGCLIVPALSMPVMISAMGVAKFLFSVQMSELSILWFDVKYFSSSGIKTASGIASGLGYVGCVLGVVLAAFLNPSHAIIMTLLASLIQIPLSCMILEPEH